MFQRRSIFLFKTSKNVFQRCFLSADVGIIGIGNMGAPMANNLVKKGRKVKVYDISEAAVQKVSGALVCSTPKEAATDVDLVVTSLPLGSIVKQVLTGEDGILKGINKNSILIDTSTLNPVVAQEFHKITEDAGVQFLDTPISGGIVGAAAGTLTFMVGGNKELLKKVEPYLMQMGTRIMYCGGPGAGQIAKLCNNLIVAVSMIGVSEAMNMAAKMGLDLKTMANVINASTGRCYSSDTYNPVPGIIPNVPSSNNYEGGFQAKFMAKDLSLVQELAVSCDASIILGSVAHQLYRAISAHGYGSKDYSVVYQFLQGQKC